MASETALSELVAREPDERLLDRDVAALPDSLGRPEALPDDPLRRRIVAVGAALTGATLVAGVALIILGVVRLLSGGTAPAVAMLVLGVALVATHWGWVHLAEWSGNGLDARRNRQLLDGRRRWLASIEPYTRWSVSTAAAQDGSIAIVTSRHEPVACGERGFTFVLQVVEREVHPAEEPAAAVAERAELLRREAAAETAREHERYELARGAYELALLECDDEQQRLVAIHAAAKALSERINANLSEPPLTE